MRRLPLPAQGKLALRLIACCLMALSAGCMMRTGPSGAALLKEIPKAIDYKPVAPETWELPNGLKVMFYEDDELPLVDGNLYIKGGSFWEPEDRTGTVAAMGTLLRQGGAGALGPDALDLELEKLSARIESQMGGEFGSMGFRCLSSDLERVFAMFSDVVRRPLFDQGRIDLWKGQALESALRRVDDANSVASISFMQLLYGRSPYGRVTVDSDIRRISRERMIEAHDRFVRPNDAILALIGKVDRARVEALVKKHFGDWEPRKAPLGPPPAVEQGAAPGIYFVSLPFSQATVQLGHLGVPRLTEDHIAINAFNQVFGSGAFSSRLMKRIRSDLGLVYGIYGSVLPGLVQGKNMVYLKTKAQTTDQAIAESIRVLADMQRNEISGQELEEAKRFIENSFIFEFDSPAAVVVRRAQLEIMGYPRDYDDTYVSKILGVTPGDIKGVSDRRWRLGELVIVVVGDETAYNSLVKLMSSPPSELEGMELRKVDFKQKLEIPS